MKRTTLIASVVLAAVFAIGTVVSVSAQQPPQRGKGQQGNLQNRQNKGNRVQKQNLDASDKLLVKAGRECGQAHRIMQNALPIYHGHRVKAMELVKMANVEIRRGLKFERTHKDETSKDLNKQVDSIKNLKEEPQGKYTQQQIDQSNKKMQKAGEILTQAKSDLQSANKEYGGHRANAIRLIDMAISEIHSALGDGNSVRP